MTKNANAKEWGITVAANGRRYSDVEDIPPGDTTPAQFSFADQTDVALSSTITSAAVTITDIDTLTTLTASGGTIDVNSDGNFQTSRNVVNGDTVRARVTSSSANSTAVDCVVTGGGISDTFTATTEAADVEEGSLNGLPLLFHDDFESGGFSTTQNGISHASRTGVAISTDNFYAGTRSARFTYTGNGAGGDSTAEARVNLGSVWSEIEIQWMQYIPNGLESYGGAAYTIRSGAPTNNKQLRVWRGNTSDGNNGYGTFYNKVGCSTDRATIARVFGEYGKNGGGMGIAGSTGNGNLAPNANPYFVSADLGTWVKFGFYAKKCTTSSDGIIRLYKNDVLVGEATNLDFLPTVSSNAGFNFMYMMGWSNSGYLNTTYFFIDDFKVFGVA